jgi:hypothetical protein
MLRRLATLALMLTFTALGCVSLVGKAAYGQAPQYGVSILPASQSAPPHSPVTIALEAQAPACGSNAGGSTGCLGSWDITIAFNTALLTFSSCQPHSGSSCISTQPGQVQVGGFDSSGNGLPGATDLADVKFTTTGAFGNQATLTPSFAASLGFADPQENSTCADGPTASPAACPSGDGPVANAGSVTILEPSADSVQSTISAAPVSVRANGTDTTTVTVTAEDSFGDPLPGKSITLKQGSGHSQPAAPTTSLIATTNSSGIASFTLADSTPEQITYTATDTTDSPNVTISTVPNGQSNVVTFRAVPVTPPSSVKASSATAPADNTTTDEIAVTLEDGSGNPIQGDTVSLGSNSATSTPVPVNGTTSNAQG